METTKQYRATQCPSQDVLLAYCSGKLPEIDLETVDSHLATCEACLAFLDSQHKGKVSATLHDEESAKSSMLDETAIQKIRKDPRFQRMAAQVKQIELTIDGDTKPWIPEVKSVEKPTTEVLPERIGRYFVVAKLGRGGFANVYLAQDSEHQRQVAIKVPRPEKLRSPAQTEEFLREARTAAKLNHPHIVPVYDFDRLPDGGCFVVMKYIEGQSLEKAMASERFSFERVAKVCTQIAEALDYAHKKKFIHRDIKPANILLDGLGVAYISDFGLAIHEDVQHDHKDEFAGTCAYMSPEQVSPGSHYFDHRTDVWSLGVVMYELLTRERLFAGRDDSVRIDKILNHPIKTPRSVDGDVPVELERICLLCLRRQINDRYPNAIEVADALRNWRAIGQIGHSRYLSNAAKAIFFIAIMGLVAGAGLYYSNYFFRGGGGSLTTTNPQQSSSQPSITAPEPTEGSSDGSKVLKGIAPLADSALLDSEPSRIFGEIGEKTAFDRSKQQYTVGPTTSRWIVTAKKIQSETVHLHATLSVNEWVGTGGFAWQIVESAERQNHNNRWLTAEFFRSGKGDSCRLVVRELRLSDAGLISDNNILRMEKVAAPRDISTALDVVIQEHLLRIEFDGNRIFEVRTPIKEVNTWTGSGELILALTGDGESTKFGNLSFGIPAKSSRLP